MKLVRLNLWLCVLGTAFFDLSCKKGNQSLVYNFTWTGTPVIRSTLTFSAPEPIGTSFRWNFGDIYSPNNTSLLAAPTFDFALSGTYTVTLVLNDDTTHKITKAITIYCDTISNTFGYSGVPCVGNSISFFASEPFKTVYNWRFGDGTATSTAENPSHIYSVTGLYTITMTLNATTIGTKPITIYPAPSGSLTSGTYHWGHKHLDNWTGIGLFDSSFTADTVLPLAVVNATTLTFLNQTYYYSPTSSSAGQEVFYFYVYTNPMENYYANGTLVFEIATDSVYFDVWTHPGPGEGVTYSDRYYTHH
jgi:PKD repeat protein